jgi:hypothetical protein
MPVVSEPSFANVFGMKVFCIWARVIREWPCDCHVYATGYSRELEIVNVPPRFTPMDGTTYALMLAGLGVAGLSARRNLLSLVWTTVLCPR